MSSREPDVPRGAAEASESDAPGACEASVAPAGATASPGDTAVLDSDDGPRAAAPRGYQRGALLDRFVILDDVGEGAMGRVLAAYDPDLDRKVAIKVLHAPRSREPRLLREAQAMARLAHPNVVTVHEVGLADGELFVVMEFVDGQTLRGWLRAEKRAIDEVVAHFVAAGRGLIAAHAAGLVHRDFKPDNVLVDRRGAVKVTDFGLVAPGEVSGAGTGALAVTLTRTGATMGTPAYMAPEQHRGDDVGPAADQFAFCASLYETLFDRRPIEGRDAATIAANAIAGEIAAPPRDAAVPAHIREALARGLRVRPADRFPSMDALLAALTTDPRTRRRRRTRTLAALAVAGAAAFFLARATGATADRCQAAGASVAGVWNAPLDARIRSAFVTAGIAGAEQTSARLTRYADALTGMRVEVCTAHRDGRDSTRMRDLRAACLDRAQAALAATGALLAGGDRDTLTSALDLATGLPPIEWCADTDALADRVPPPDGATDRARLRALDQALAGTEVLLRAGKVKEALVRAETLQADADALGYGPVRARAALLLGEAQREAGELETSAATLRGAGELAAEAREDRVMARAWSMLVLVLGDSLGRPDQAEAILPFARAAARRLGDPRIEGELEYYTGLLRHAAARYDDALEHYRLADQQYALLEDAEKLRLDVEESMHRALHRLGRHDEALAGLEHVLTAQRILFGGDHPHMGTTLSHMGLILKEMGRLDLALAHFERGHRIVATLLGEHHHEAVKLTCNMASVHMNAGRHDRAAEAFEACRVGLTAAVGASSTQLATVLHNMGILELHRGNLAGAVAHYRDSLGRFQQILGPSHPTTASVQSALANGLAHLGELDEARSLIREAIAVTEKALGGDHASVGYRVMVAAEIEYRARNCEAALPLFVRAEESLIATHGEQFAELAVPLTRRSDCLRHLGRRAEAIVAAERAIHLLSGSSVDPRRRAAAELALAKALWATGRDRPRALALAESARSLYADAGAAGDTGRAQAETWLASRR